MQECGSSKCKVKQTVLIDKKTKLFHKGINAKGGNQYGKEKFSQSRLPKMAK